MGESQVDIEKLAVWLAHERLRVSRLETRVWVLFGMNVLSFFAITMLRFGIL